NTGAASAPMALVGALEDAKVGDKILLAAYGDGAETFVLKVEGKFNHAGDRRAIKKHLASKLVLPNYDLYLRWRQLVPQEAARRPPPPVPSVMALWRERDQNIRLYGMKCKSCGRIQYPPQRVCTYCHAKDEREMVRLSDRKGEVFTYSMDYLAGTPDIPLVITIVNFEGGGRMLCMMTDREVDKMKVGLPVEMSFRKLHTVAGIPNYYWKSTPVRV
ncbi:MAG: zinc ribbon domain-containing protein, partial [Chloroflexota bacterium]|nr:zinc ribbon domain-containing protein [Chloroflexota bacterium]